MNVTRAEQARRRRRRPGRQLVRRLVQAIRENDERKVEQAVLQLAGTRKILAPLALAGGAFVMLFSGLRLLVTNWRLMLVQALPAMWIWAATLDLKVHVLHGREFSGIRGPAVLALFAAVTLITIAAFHLNAVFAFAIAQPGPTDLRAGFRQARRHVKTIAGWGTGIGLALAVATMLAPRWGLGWFALLLGIVLAVMMVCYVAVPAQPASSRKRPATRHHPNRTTPRVSRRPRVRLSRPRSLKNLKESKVPESATTTASSSPVPFSAGVPAVRSLDRRHHDRPQLIVAKRDRVALHAG